MNLQDLANIAQIIIFIWGLFVGTLTLPHVLKRLVRYLWSLVAKPAKHFTAGSPSGSPWEEFAYLLRNSFSIIPLIFTWYSLATAVSSYQKYLQAHPLASTKPFLLLWQEGFGGTSLTFYQVAFIDAFLLIIFLMLIILSFVFEKRHQREQNEVPNAVTSVKLDGVTKNEATSESNQAVTNIGLVKIAEGLNIVFQNLLKEITLELNSKKKSELDEIYHEMKELADSNKSAIENIERHLLRQREDLDRIITQVANGLSENHKNTDLLSEVEKQLLETTIKMNKLVDTLSTVNIMSSKSIDDLNSDEECNR